MKNRILIPLISLFLIFSCTNKNEGEEVGTKKIDSLNIKLNSPELKEINAELLKDASNASLYNKRALVYLKLREFPEAENDCKRAIKIDSTQALFHLTLVDIYFSENKTRDSKELLEATAKRFPNNTEALLKLAELYFLVRRYQDGIEYVNKTLKINENLAKAYYIKGSIYRESGDTARAISSLETAVEQDNKYVDAFYDLGILYGARKNPLAIEYYNNVLRVDPTNPTANYAKAKLLQDLGKIDEAIKLYEAILTTNKTCENCYYNLGAIYLEIKKDPKKALEEFTKAIEINPNYVEAYFARGYTYSKLKDKESAKADYAMCLKIQPNYDAAVDELNNL
ncbi:tetratricopeptide repeat protein [Aurantibacillus circumpalustris]|uniref:tetratricopeptide repeat protein n=1 Tax=Aurantibacillus circumpalustris TaxID=3036359 RepID=UPI00295B751D|nr:tetratricopeptide repeat protein [Aurantibacillus circumpalustris]